MRNTTSKLFYSILYPSVFVALLWVVRLVEYYGHLELGWYGLYPRTAQGLTGILTSPLIHADANHLYSNSIPLLILGAVMFYFYRPIAFQVFFWVYIMTGIWVWVAARDAYHIGASGLVYGFLTFLFFSGVFRKDTRLLAISLFVTFLYGSTMYGVLPITKGISWESHLMGSLAGLVTAYHFRKEGPLPRKYDLGDDDDENTNPDLENEIEAPTDVAMPAEETNTNIGDDTSHQPDLNVHYTFVPKEKKEE